jgi:hypothetical protein
MLRCISKTLSLDRQLSAREGILESGFAEGGSE